MSKGIIFHDRDIQYDIDFSSTNQTSPATDPERHEEHPSASDDRVLAPACGTTASPPIRDAGDLYITGDNIFIGKDHLWYRMQVSEIESIRSRLPTRKLTLGFEGYHVELGTMDPAHLNAVRHFLMLYRSRIRRGGAA